MQPAELLQRLIRFDTTNPPGAERECVTFLEGLLRDAGLETRLLAADDDRPNLIARLPGEGSAPPLLLQGHVDVVSTAGQDWTHPPFDGVVEDGYVWGRGALDMKGGVAMLVGALLREPKPAGDVILCVLSDEEAGGDRGARFLVERHAELFEGVRYAIGEFGGFSMEIAGRRFYPVQVAEKRICWMRATVRGPGGHGSLPMRGGTMARLAKALRALDRGRLPIHVTDVPRRMIEGIAAELPRPASAPLRGLLDQRLADPMLRVLGEAGRSFEPMLRNTVNATIVRAGDKVNVVPGEATVELDGRVLPGFTPADMLREVRAVTGDDVEIEVSREEPTPSGEVDYGLFDLLSDVIRDRDPAGVPVPYLMPGVTDGRWFATLGIQTYGFLPMQLPKDLRFMHLIHAADERIPVEAVEFGTGAIAAVLERYGR
ncbi:MAG: M20/M25/M40 family metallo-hydrolase [Actinomycetota bacterium]|nr:M20/M25/M40 family metallo-hydrolase [Actinomycetota bacterium]MDQ5808274.1 M20/M25/M40 family metallo-hydrolase [Actinomycetota bacterium]